MATKQKSELIALRRNADGHRVEWRDDGYTRAVYQIGVARRVIPAA